MNLPTAIEGFLLSKSADGLSQNTLHVYRLMLRKMLTFLGDVEISTITTDDLRRWHVWLTQQPQRRNPGKDAPLSLATRKNAWRAMKSFFAWAHDEFNLTRPDAIKQPEGDDTAINPFTPDELRRLLRAAEWVQTVPSDKRKSFTMRLPTADRNVALLLVLLDTGLRAGEVLRLTVGDVDLQAGQVRVKAYGTGKKTKARNVYIGRTCRKALWKYQSTRPGLQLSDPLFTTDDGQPATYNTLKMMLARIAARAGVANAHPHRFRHTFSVEYLRNGGDVFTLQRLLGHSSMDMVRRYLMLADADDAAAHRIASPADHIRVL